MPKLGNARKARLSIPRVQNPNGSITAPRSAAHSPTSPRIGNAQVVPRPKPKASAAPTTTAGSTSEAAAASPVTAPTPVNTPQIGSDPFATPAYSNPQGVDPRDATYWANLSKLQFQDRTEYAKNLAEQTKADSDYSIATQEALRNRVSNQRQIGESTLSNGLANSGYHDRIGTEATTQFNTERSNAELSKHAEDAARAAARKALVDGYSIEAAGLIGEAAGRYAEGHVAQAEEEGPEFAPESNPAPSSSPTKNAIKKKKNAISNNNALRPGQGVSNNRKAK